MKIVHIFEIVKDSLYAVSYENETEEHTFHAVFNKWQNVEHLEDFFEKNKADLLSEFYGGISVDEAVLRTLSDAAAFEKKILRVAKQGQKNEDKTLEKLVFKSLHDKVYSHKHIESKAYGSGMGWLRVYAIRIAPNVYVVSGGAIKITKEMSGRKHLEDELKKLKLTADFLKEIGLIEEEDLGFIEFGNDEE